MLLLAGSLTNAQTIKRRKQKTEQTTKPKAKQEQKKQKPIAGSSQSNSIKSNEKHKNGNHNTELVKAIDEIVASINSIKSIDDSESQKHIDNAIRVFNNKIKNNQFIKQKHCCPVKMMTRYKTHSKNC